MTHLKSMLFAGSMLFLPGIAMAQVGPGEYPLGAVLPSSRAAVVGATVTVWASLINMSANAADCHINQWSSDDAPYLTAFHYQAYSNDGASAQAAQDTPVSVPGGGSQNFLLSFVTSQPFTARDIELGFGCSQSSGHADMLWGPRMTGTNTLRLTSVAGSTPDIITVADTTSRDGVVHVGPNGAMAVAALNIGDAVGSESVYVVPDFGTDKALPFTLAVCETNPSDGTCLSGSGSSFITADMSAGTKTFSVFVSQIPGSPAGAMLYPDIGKIRLGFYYDTATDKPETGMSAPMTALPGDAGTEYGSTALAAEAAGPGQSYMGPLGPYEAALLHSNGYWWHGKAVGAWQAPSDSLIVGKFDLPDKDWSYYIFVRPGVVKDGEGQVQSDFSNGAGDMHTFVVFNDGAFPTERRSVNVSGTFEHLRGFNLMMAETGYTTLDLPASSNSKVKDEHLDGPPVNVRGTQHLEWNHDLSGTALSDYFYHPYNDPYNGISISPSMMVSGSFDDGAGGRCYINSGNIIPNADGYNSFFLQFTVSAGSGCTANTGTYEGAGARMYSASGDWDPNSLWALVYRTMDLSHNVTNDTPTELLLAADPPN